MSDAPDDGRKGAGRTPALRLVAVVPLALATAVTMAGGLWAAWTQLFGLLPPAIGIPATLGCLAAPVALVSIIIDVDREETARRREKEPE